VRKGVTRRFIAKGKSFFSNVSMMGTHAMELDAEDEFDYGADVTDLSTTKDGRTTNTSFFQITINNPTTRTIKPAPASRSRTAPGAPSSSTFASARAGIKATSLYDRKGVTNEDIHDISRSSESDYQDDIFTIAMDVNLCR